jgi:hypothetical protein
MPTEPVTTYPSLEYQNQDPQTFYSSFIVIPNEAQQNQEASI